MKKPDWRTIVGGIALPMLLVLVAPAAASAGGAPPRACPGLIQPAVLAVGQHVLIPWSLPLDGSSEARPRLEATRTDGRHRTFYGGSVGPDLQGFMDVWFRGGDIGRWRLVWTFQGGSCVDHVTVGSNVPDTSTIGADEGRLVPRGDSRAYALALLGLLGSAVIWSTRRPGRQPGVRPRP